VNERIRVNQVLVITETGEQLGVMGVMEGIRLARERGLDLVEVAPNLSPPVCRILDFNKLRYEQEKREREAKHKHHSSRLKEMKFKPRIEDHDYRIKLTQIKKFLVRGDKVKVTMVYRGREMARLDLGQRVVARLIGDLSSFAKVEKTPFMEGRFMTMIIAPDVAAVKRVVKAKPATPGAADAAQPASPTTS
jgi:translation initiation factor IF-3